MDYRWDDIRVFLALYRERTLASAGAKLRLDASTVSRRLVAFEEALGTSLFDRTREGLLPTAAALDLAPLAESMEEAALRFEERADAIDGAIDGNVRLTAPPMVAETFVAPIMPRLLERHPGLRIELDVSQRRLDLSRGEADIAMRDGPQAPGDIVVTRLLTLPYAVLAAPAVAERLGMVERLEDLRWVTWAEPVAHLTSATWLAANVPSIEPVFRSSSLGAQLAAVEAGLGVILAPSIFRHSHEVVALRLGPQPEMPPSEELWLAAARSRRSLPRVAAVWSFLLEVAKEIEG